MKLDQNSLNRLFRVHCLMQIASEQIEEMQNNSVFKHDNKQRLNNTNTWLTKLTENFTESCSKEEIDFYNQATEKIRQITNEINFTINGKE
jgi:phage terminase large subunit GpA-like protein